jgi:hypothetical protein
MSPAAEPGAQLDAQHDRALAELHGMVVKYI